MVDQLAKHVSSCLDTLCTGESSFLRRSGRAAAYYYLLFTPPIDTILRLSCGEGEQGRGEGRKGGRAGNTNILDKSSP